MWSICPHLITGIKHNCAFSVPQTSLQRCFFFQKFLERKVLESWAAVLQNFFALGAESIGRTFASSHHLLGSLWAPHTPTPTESHVSVLAKTWFRSYRPKAFKHKGSAQKGWFKI